MFVPHRRRRQILQASTHTPVAAAACASSRSSRSTEESDSTSCDTTTVPQSLEYVPEEEGEEEEEEKVQLDEVQLLQAMHDHAQSDSTEAAASPPHQATSSSFSMGRIAETLTIPLPSTRRSFVPIHTPITQLQRRYPCRICQQPLSSCSNRLRHERLFHPIELEKIQARDGNKTRWKAGGCQRNKELMSAAWGNAKSSSTIEEHLKAPTNSPASKGNDDHNAEIDVEVLMSDEPFPCESDPSVEVWDKQSGEGASESNSEEATLLAESDKLNLDREETESSESEGVAPLPAAPVEGIRPPLQESQFEEACKPFFEWLGASPVSQCEALVKQKRVKTPSQLQPYRSNLRFLFALLYDRKVIDASVDLSVFARLDICQSLYNSIQERGVAAGRVFILFLLIKKCLVYLSSIESTRLRQFVQPTTFASYLYVDNICSDSSTQRKQDARNRMVLGASTSAAIRTAVVQNSSMHMAAAAAASSIAAPTTIEGSSGTMTKDELQRVTSGCLRGMDQIINSGSPTEMDQSFVHYLITATLCLGLAPRSQVLRQLQIGSTFVKQLDGRYWIRILAEMSKNAKPTLFALAEELTGKFDVYLSVIRPRLLSKCRDAEAAKHSYVFFKRNGSAPRSDFGSSTATVTQILIGRPINPHQFRSALITTFYESGANSAEMSNLATIMSHDPATQRQFYFKPVQAQASLETSRRMLQQLLPA